MIALMKKDWRLFRVPVVGGIVLHLIPYFIYGFITWWNWKSLAQPQLGPELAAMSGPGFAIIMIIAAVLGGAALAQERRDRSADFQAMLPVSRAQIIASKVIVSALILLAFAIFDISIFLLASMALNPSTENSRPDRGEMFQMFISFTLLAYGAAWLGSSFLSSPAIAASASLALLLTSALWPNLLPNSFPIREYQIAEWTALVLGVGCLVAGTVYYLKRIEP
jgi:ABC-type transport system involved in multi-copper enzyme maturation permease subunit